jgi:hypothetical protein
MKMKYVALWRLREQALFRVSGTLPGWKLHDPEHFPDFIKAWGPVWGWETGPFEMFNKVVKDLWHKTSGRKLTECHELLKQDLLRTLMLYHEDKISFMSRRYCSEPLFFSEEVPEKSEFKVSATEKISELSVDFTDPVFQIFGDISNDHFKKFSITSNAFNLEMTRFFREQNYEPVNNFRLILRDRVTITGSEESSLGTVLLHAYSKVGHHLLDDSNVTATAWYSFVLIKVLGGKHLLAQLMGIFEVVDEINHKSNFCFFVKYLEEVEQNEYTGSMQNLSDFVSVRKLVSEYRWAAGGTNRYDIGIVSEDSIADIAFVVPSFYNNPATHSSSNHTQDRFYFIHRKFFDRSGWTFQQNHTPLQQQKSSSRLSSEYSSCNGGSTSSSDTSVLHHSGTGICLGRNPSPCSNDDFDRLLAYLSQDDDTDGQPISDFTAEFLFADE